MKKIKVKINYWGNVSHLTTKEEKQKWNNTDSEFQKLIKGFLDN